VAAYAVHMLYRKVARRMKGTPTGKQVLAGWKQLVVARRVRWRGQSMVELALMLPVITLLLVGTVDLGRAFFGYIRLTNAVREGALLGMTYPAHVTATSVPGMSGDPLNIEYQVKQEDPNIEGVEVRCYEARTTALKSGTGACSQASSGDTIQVRATYKFTPITKQMMGIFGNSTFQMRKAVRMVIL
jgi:Flp pilus assembly protein TadG